MKETRVPMNHVSLKSRILVAALAAGMLGLSACSSEGPASSASSSGGLSGEIVGSGATSQESAQTTWRSAFTKKQAGIKVSYNGGGSGKGASDFTSGAVAFAGSDDALSLDAMKAGSFAGCAESSNALNLPIYVSPIAMVYNVDGVKNLKLDATTAASIFSGKITKWNDPAIAALNSGETLPDTAITVVHRSDKSGTTQNFVSYFKDVTPDNWTYDLSENWPNEVGQGAKGTSGVISTVKQADGTIGYADFSQVGDLGTVAVKVGDKYNEISAEAGSKVIGDSKQDDTVKGDNRIVIKINHATEAEGAYPIVLVSYDIVCPAYKDTKQAEFAKAWLTYVTSDEGQKAAQDAAGTAPLPSSLKSEITKSIEAIKTK